MKTIFLTVAVLLLAGCSESQKGQNAPVKASNSAAAAQTAASSDILSQTEASAIPSYASAASAAHSPISNEYPPAVLFQKCAACHGNHAEKPALNQSAVIGQWDSERIASAIFGYQNGTYGGAMKTLMQNQVKGLSHVDVEALSEYIANLYVKTH